MEGRGLRPAPSPASQALSPYGGDRLQAGQSPVIPAGEGDRCECNGGGAVRTHSFSLFNKEI